MSKTQRNRKGILSTVFLLISLLVLGQDPTVTDLWNIYQARDFNRVIETAYPLWKKDTANIELNLILGSSHASNRSYTQALPYLDYCAKNDSRNSWIRARAWSDLGSCYFMLQDFPRSKTYLMDCIQLHATKNITNDAYGKTLLFGFHDAYSSWKTIQSEHFTFHFQSMPDAEITRFVATREKAFGKIDAFFKSSLPKKIDMFVWNSNDDARKVLGVTLGFSKPEFCIIHTLFNQTVGHEMTHVISNYTSEIKEKTRFINEGTAVCFDQTGRDGEIQVKEWIKANNTKVSIKDLWLNNKPSADEILYPMSGLFVKKLIERFGKEKFLTFFINQTYGNAQKVFGEQLELLIQDVENKVNN